MENSTTKKNWKRTFFLFWASQLISLLGSMLVQFTLVWWLTEKTGSATVLAIATMVALIPEIIIQPFAGAIVDRLNRKTVIITADAIIAAATLGLGILFYFDRVEVWLIYTVMVLRAIGGAFHFPAQMASVSLMVPEKQLARIAGLNQAARGIMNIISAPLGALMLEYLGAQSAMLVDVITAAAAISIVTFITIPMQQKLEKRDKSWFGTILQDMKEGYQYLVSWKGLMVLTAIVLIFKIALTPAFSLIPLLVYKHLHGNAAQYSMVDVVGGIGIILGGLVLGAWGGFKKNVYTMILGGCGVGVGILLMGFLPEGEFLWILPIIFLVGFMIPIVDGPIHAVLQAKIDNEYQGRVTTLFGSIINLSGPIGLAAAGPLSDTFGLQIWFITAGILIFAMMLLGSFNKHLMNIDKGPEANGLANG